MNVNEMTPGQALFFRFLRSECVDCGNEDLSWVQAEMLHEELGAPQWDSKQRDGFRSIIKDGLAREGVFAWLCTECGEVGAVEGGVF